VEADEGEAMTSSADSEMRTDMIFMVELILVIA
jgi:hypothetical protein